MDILGRFILCYVAINENVDKSNLYSCKVVWPYWGSRALVGGQLSRHIG